MEDKKQAERKAFIRKTALQSFKIVLLGVLLIFVYLIVFACNFAGSEEEPANGDAATAAQYRDVSAESI